MSTDSDLDAMLFDVETPLGFRVRCTEEYWKRKVLADHDNMAGMVEERDTGARGTRRGESEFQRL